VKFKKITAKVSMKELKAHYTEAKLVQLLEEKGIGRPSTFAYLIEKIQQSGYVKKENVNGICINCVDYEVAASGSITQVRSEREFGNEKNKLVIKPLGIMVLDYLLAHFQPLFAYDYTKTMEVKLDDIAHDRLLWTDVCKECLTDLDGEIQKIVEAKKGKEQIRIDNEHSYIMGKYGPVLKCTDAEKNVSFKPVNPDLDLVKLRTGAYALTDVVLTPDLAAEKKGRNLGVYGEKEVVLRAGKFGWYLEWGTEKKALKLTLPEASALTLDDVSETLYDLENGESGVIRVINTETSIRKGKGQLDDYIFHKNKKMKKPKFLKLTGFQGDYRTCAVEVLQAWLKKTYDINTF